MITKTELIAELEKIRDAIVDCDELSDYARDKSYTDVSDAIEQLRENYQGE